MRLKHVTTSEAETVALGHALGNALLPGDIVLLDGALGAGKTRLVRGVVAGLGGDPDDVSSPTFVFVNEYDTPVAPLVHVDAYRLSGPDDLDSIGWDAALSGDPPAIALIEWGERVAAAIEGSKPAHLLLEHTGGDRRRITIELPPNWLDRPALGALFDLVGGPLPRNWAHCPTTSRAVHASVPTFPFVDERAQMADLGKWLSGEYTLSREMSEEDLDDPDLPQP